MSNKWVVRLSVLSLTVILATLLYVAIRFWKGFAQSAAQQSEYQSFSCNITDVATESNPDEPSRCRVVYTAEDLSPAPVGDEKEFNFTYPQNGSYPEDCADLDDRIAKCETEDTECYYEKADTCYYREDDSGVVEYTIFLPRLMPFPGIIWTIACVVMLVQLLLEISRRLKRPPVRQDVEYEEGQPDVQELENVADHYQKAEAEPDAVCSICLDNLDGDAPDQSIVQIRCQHTFHEACITKWLTGRGGLTCPVCRSSVKEGEAPSPEVVVT